MLVIWVDKIQNIANLTGIWVKIKNITKLTRILLKQLYKAHEDFAPFQGIASLFL